MNSPFHPGEQAIQAQAGVREKVEEIGKRVIRSFMPEQHREFFAQQPWLLVGSLASDGQPQASLVWGAPGFTHSPEPTRLRIDALAESDDPLATNLAPGARLGLLGLELPSRRRNRMNGTVIAADAEGFSVEVRQSFGNCPKYIQARSWQAAPRESGPLEQGDDAGSPW